MMEYDVKRCTRRCEATNRDLAEGETYYSVLVLDGAELHRHDYSTQAWHGPPSEGVIGWWKAQVPSRQAKHARMAPNEVLLELFQDLQGQPEAEDMLYVLALLLVRRRVFRLEESQFDTQGREVLALYCPRQETTYHVQVKAPSESRINEIQNHLGELLFAGAE